MNPTEGVRPGTAAIVALVSGGGCWLLLQISRSFGLNYPVVSWIGLVPLVMVAGLVLVLAWQIRRYLRGDGTFRPSPQRGRGTLVGAQAAALGGAGLLGWYAANALVQLPNADVPSVRVQVVLWLVHVLVAGLLSVVGFVGQAWCRIPPAGDDDEDGAPEGDLAYG